MATHPVTFGIVTAQEQVTFAWLVETWRAAEAAGFDSGWLFDHFLALRGEEDGITLEASTVLAGLAVATERIELGVLVYGNTHRLPTILAKEMATIDHMSGGRVILGIGAGWNAPEHAAYAIPFPSAGDRVSMLEEALEIIALLSTQERTSYAGRFYTLENAPFNPKPVRGRFPIVVGGNKPRMLGVIGRHADLWDSGGDPDEIRAGLATISGHAVAAGRDAGAVAASKNLGGEPLASVEAFRSAVRAYGAAGTRQFLFRLPTDDEGRDRAIEVAASAMPGLREELAG